MLRETDMQDYDVVKLCLEGKTQEFEKLVEKYQRLVYSIALNYLKDSALAEDASQEAFIKAFKHLRSYNPEFRFSTWLTRITTNTCSDMLRKRRDLTPLDEAFEIADKGETPEDYAVRKDKKEKLDYLVNALDPKYKQPLLLYHVSGLKYEEIAEHMRVPMSIVKNRIFRARKMLKEALEGY